MPHGIRRRPSASTIWRFLFPVALGALVAMLMLSVMYGFVTPTGAPWERAWLLRAHAFFGDAGTRAAQLITELGYAKPIAAIGLVLILWWIVRGAWWKSVVLAIDMLVLEALNTYAKDEFHRLRPNLFPHEAVAGFSFPSGHAFAAVAFFGCVAYLVAMDASPSLRRVIWVGWAALALLLGGSRIVLGVHWPTDVVGGFLAGAILLAGVIAGVRRWRPQER